MKKWLCFVICAVMLLALCACGAQTEEPPAVSEETAEWTREGYYADESADFVAVFEEDPDWQDPEETVQYEHVINDTAGFEIDYDHGSFMRRSEADRECFISIYDDPDAPENYLELTRSTDDAETAAAAIIEELSRDYDITQETRELENAGACIWIEASVIKGTDNMADQLQWVYIIPAHDGCIVARAHSFIVESEGFGHRFSYMMDTLAILDRNGE